MKLNLIFPGRLVILDKVQQELFKRKSESLVITNFIYWNKIQVIPMPADLNIIKEYAALRKTRGEGESACMAVARFSNQFIASSNLRDIKTYCDTHKITYYTTMDILTIALNHNIMSEKDCDAFIQRVISKGSKLPCNTMKEFRKISCNSLSSA